jgi:hypothetical protein
MAQETSSRESGKLRQLFPDGNQNMTTSQKQILDRTEATIRKLVLPKILDFNSFDLPGKHGCSQSSE